MIIACLNQGSHQLATPGTKGWYRRGQRSRCRWCDLFQLWHASVRQHRCAASPGPVCYCAATAMMLMCARHRAAGLKPRDAQSAEPCGEEPRMPAKSWGRQRRGRCRWGCLVEKMEIWTVCSDDFGVVGSINRAGSYEATHKFFSATRVKEQRRTNHFTTSNHLLIY
jgi:hypothetical protein